MVPTTEPPIANRIYSLTITLRTHSRTMQILKSDRTILILLRNIPNQRNLRQQLTSWQNAHPSVRPTTKMN